MSEEKAWVLVIGGLTLAFCVAVVGGVYRSIRTANKDTDTAQTTRMVACINAGGTWIRNDECIQSRCPN